MSITYVPEPALLPSSIELPQDVVDKVNAASIDPTLSQLADAIALQQRISSSMLRAYITAGDFNGALIPQLVFAGGGISIQDTTDFVFEDTGYYWFSLMCFISHETDPDLPVAIGFRIPDPFEQLLFSYSIQSPFTGFDCFYAYVNGIMPVEAGQHIQAYVDGGARSTTFGDRPLNNVISIKRLS